MPASLVVIVGETASGKSALALYLARKFNGEIICADSRTVYKGMDIGTAKPSKEEQAEVPHHILDIVEPDEPFSVGKFKELALEKIKEIKSRGKLPIMVGGTGLYSDSVIFDFPFRPEGAQKDVVNPRHLKQGTNAPYTSLRPNTLVLGISISKEVLERRIEARVGQMIEQGLQQEVEKLAATYGWETEAMTGTGYREWQAYFAGTQTLEETKQLIIIRTRQYAKRQRSWFKRNKYIQWLPTPDEAHALVEQFLNN